MKFHKYITIFCSIIALISCHSNSKEKGDDDLLNKLVKQYMETNTYFVNMRVIDNIPIDTNKNNIIVYNRNYIFLPQMFPVNQVIKIINSEGINTVERVEREIYNGLNIAILIEYSYMQYNIFIKTVKNRGLYIKWHNDSFYSKFHKLYGTPVYSDGDHVNWDIGFFTDSLETNLSYETIKLYFPDFNGTYVYNPNVSIRILGDINDKNIDSLKYLIKFESKK